MKPLHVLIGLIVLQMTTGCALLDRSASEPLQPIVLSPDDVLTPATRERIARINRQIVSGASRVAIFDRFPVPPP
jgi:hypothetical protein